MNKQLNERLTKSTKARMQQTPIFCRDWFPHFLHSLVHSNFVRSIIEALSCNTVKLSVVDTEMARNAILCPLYPMNFVECHTMILNDVIIQLLPKDQSTTTAELEPSNLKYLSQHYRECIRTHAPMKDLTHCVLKNMCEYAYTYLSYIYEHT